MKSKKMFSVVVLTAGLLLSSVTLGNADQSPTPTPSKSASATSAEWTAYKAALIEYRIALVVNSISFRATMEKYWSDWRATVEKYEAAYKAAIEQFQIQQAAYLAKLEPIRATHRAAVNKADADFLAAIAGAKSVAEKELALKNYATANSTANAAFKAAVTAVGPAPIRPVKPAELSKPPLPVKPAEPQKPVAPKKNDNNQKNN
ncbi:MAG: hypothetical protein HY050_08075 [Actinobacteria bacterium]|nr:hypothetical protein [Actinomycetota bacterium]